MLKRIIAMDADVDAQQPPILPVIWWLAIHLLVFIIGQVVGGPLLNWNLISSSRQ
jgi:hypothetical protein